MHINDSARKLGSKVDRHAPLQKGLMGNEVFSMIMNDERLDNIPLILETTQPEIWKDEIEWLYSLVKNK